MVNNSQANDSKSAVTFKPHYKFLLTYQRNP